MKRLTLMLTLALSGLFFAGAFEQADARGRHHVYIRIGPPAARIVVRPASPWRDGIWIDGYWGWEHGRHVWIDGRWARPVRGHFWVDGRWVHTRHGWEWNPGYWRKGDWRNNNNGRDRDWDRDRDRNRDRDKDRGRDNDRGRGNNRGDQNGRW